MFLLQLPVTNVERRKATKTRNAPRMEIISQFFTLPLAECIGESFKIATNLFWLPHEVHRTSVLL